MTRIKICGVTLPDDAAAVASAGVDFIGLNFWPKSKRYLAPERAPMISGVIRAMGSAKLVGIFVNPEPDDVLAVLGRVELDIIQLHGQEDIEHVRDIAKAVYRPVWKAIAVKSPRDLEHLDQWPAEALLLDAPTAGAGATFDHALARAARVQFPQLKIILAGGLAPENVGAAIANVKPWAVDVASGVEAGPGVKDRAKLAAFIAAVGASA